MKKTISLQDFLAMDSNKGIHKTSEQWLYHWKLACESIQQEMPEPGEEVYTLVGGHCGSGADLRTVHKIDENYIYIKTIEGEHTSLVAKDIWWKVVVRKHYKTNIDISKFRKFYNLIYFVALGR